MEQSPKQGVSDLDIRHFIYAIFAETSRPPSTFETADHFRISIAAVENAHEGLDNDHHIALALGSHAIWMAHPFSSPPTNYVTQVGHRKYWGN